MQKVYIAQGQNYVEPYFFKASCGDVKSLKQWIECLFGEKGVLFFDGYSDKEVVEYIKKNYGVRIMKVNLIRFPNDEDWLGVKQRALVTVGRTSQKTPTQEWRVAILNAQHSPIRYLMFSFYLEDIPAYVSTHLARHKHAEPYIKSQRNDRQNDYDRTKAPQDSPVNMIYDVNAEELITIAHKRLCNQADAVTRFIVKQMMDAVVEKCPEFKDMLVPLCEYRNGKCTEFKPCGKEKTFINEIK